jgi:hypothetical protein
MSNLTPWFPNTIKPFRSGVYEVHTPNASSGNKFAYFDKKGWRLCGSEIFEAQREKHYPDDMHCSSMNVKGSMWRGLTKEGKETFEQS